MEYNQSGDLSFTVSTNEGKKVITVHADHNYKLEVEQLGRCVSDGEAQHVSPEFTVMNAKTIDMALEAMGY